MRENLIFYGIPETGPEDSTEPCENLVKSFIKDHLKIDTQEMVFDRAHRLGVKRGGISPRPIIVKFHYYQQRENVRKTAFTLRSDLKENQLGVGVQIPKEWRESRKTLNAVFDEEKRKGKSVKFVGDKLYVNGQVYNPPTSHVG